MNTPHPFPEDAAGTLPDTAALDALERLHTRSVDALSGFEKMVETAEPSFRPVAETFRALHASQSERLALMLTESGRAPDEDGSIMATVNRAVVATRAFFDEIDTDVMDQVRSGEDYVLSAFDAAITEVNHAERAAELHSMRDALAALLTETADLA